MPAQHRSELEDILSDKVFSVESVGEHRIDDDDTEIVEEAKPGFCVECKDQSASMHCSHCNESFCEVCYGMIHRTGKRALHTASSITTANGNEENGRRQSTSESNTEEGEDISLHDNLTMNEPKKAAGPTFEEIMIHKAKFIPLRLSLDERKYLRLLEAALNVSEYTDRVDGFEHKSKAKRIVAQIKDICAVLSGLVTACDYKRGQELFADRTFEQNEEFFQKIFEIGRRHKIMNPEKMRSAYGKLMYMLMDSAIPEVEEMLGFSCVIPIKTVYSFLKEHNGLGVLTNEIILLATMEIVPTGKTRIQIQTEIKRKERSIEQLSRKYSNPKLSADEIRHCLYSIGDNNAYLRANRHNVYKLMDTGQGVQRMQPCPAIGREMHRTLYKAQKKAKTWVGSSVIHLGDKNVPNALMFIDKYNQVAKILNPIVLTLDHIDDLCKDDGLNRYVQNTFGGVDQCKKEILLNFFRGAFDGSGADNFYDAGSCIDGRLTSAWNWCSQIEQKPFFTVFLLTGFVGFDGGGWN
ncbi:hypothetical protein INT44_009013 [Umbelopsis vinacea]|uniref:B box-type domain-containing protein n=1 Tax=Umbelopsis vinacea TaxID=44442 RepID=A0A8H7Q0U4_9FUNG|nr:hypothetical protein INT44_009013 [Umbelopsis vinacea]